MILLEYLNLKMKEYVLHFLEHIPTDLSTDNNRGTSTLFFKLVRFQGFLSFFFVFTDFIFLLQVLYMILNKNNSEYVIRVI